MYADLARLHLSSLSRFAGSCTANNALGMISLVIRNPGADLELRVSILRALVRPVKLYVRRLVRFAKLLQVHSIMPSSRIGLLRKRLCYQTLD
jgi:hypothetical protein